MAGKKPRVQLERRTYKGIVLFENEIEEIEKMDTRHDDIWVCSFPRSGTTLTQELVYLVQTCDFEKAHNVQLDERFPIIEVKDDRFPYYRGVKYIEEMQSPRFIKSHLHHFLLPEQLQKGKGRIIYICRNPKDIVTSFYRIMQWLDDLVDGDKTFDQFVDTFVNGTAVNCPWSKHVLQYWEHRNDDNVLFLQYEDVIEDRSKTVRRIADFLKKELTDEQVEKICEYCQFENMKNNDKCNMSYYRSFKYVNDEAEGSFMNKGKAGVWRELLTPETAARIDGMIRELDGSGLVMKVN